MQPFYNRTNRYNSAQLIATIRPGSIGLSAGIGKIARERGGGVLISVDAKRKVLALEFIDIKSGHDGLYVVGADGGSNDKYDSRVIQPRALFNAHPWLYDVARFPAINRRFYVQPIENHWIISISPAIELSVGPNETPLPGIGAYRYMRDGKPVYYGEGDVAKRVKEDARDGWKFDQIIYSITNDKTLAKSLQDSAIATYEKIAGEGRLPEYNRQRGKSLKKQKQNPDPKPLRVQSSIAAEGAWR